jgi:hypothetical protein
MIISVVNVVERLLVAPFVSLTDKKKVMLVAVPFGELISNYTNFTIFESTVQKKNQL